MGGPFQGELRLSTEQLAAAVGVSQATLARLVRLAIVEPATPEGDQFTAETAVRLRKMLRLHSDLGVDLYGIAIILDLLERLESLESELGRRRG